MIGRHLRVIRGNLRSPFLVMALAAVMTGCGTTPKKPTPPATSSKYYSDDGPPTSVPDNIDTIPNAVPRDESFHRFANRPYTVFGVSYVPVVNKQPSKERGIASWYGRKFHGQRTASGEPYDMFAMTAAHKTMPIPSYAKVTNLANGKSVVVRINDRGPFHAGRVIDLSYAAAHRIDLAKNGSGMVEVERVFGEEGSASSSTSSTVVAASAVPALPVMPVPASPPQPAFETPMLTQEPQGLWLQLGAFASPDAAENFREHVVRELTWMNEPVTVQSRDGLHRVRIGPYKTATEAGAIGDQVRKSMGFAPVVTK
jgi:rare lipoprotein A